MCKGVSGSKSGNIWVTGIVAHECIKLSGMTGIHILPCAIVFGDIAVCLLPVDPTCAVRQMDVDFIDIRINAVGIVFSHCQRIQEPQVNKNGFDFVGIRVMTPDQKILMLTGDIHLRYHTA